MSRIYLLRHAKAVPTLPGIRDFDRPLEEKGSARAAALGETMLAHGLVPDRIICSTSVRTRQTLQAIAALLPFEIETDFSAALYDGGPEAYFEAIHAARDAKSVMLIGHNPMTEDAAVALCGHGDQEQLTRMRHGFPTCGFAAIDLAGSLETAARGNGTLVHFITDGRF